MMRPFTHHDYPTIQEWFKKRKMYCIPYRYLPMTGIIRPEEAAGFLINTDCRVGILDFFITNPDASAPVRALALEAIADQLVQDARRAGLKYIKCDTKFTNLKRIVDSLGFFNLGEVSSFFKEL